jgi:S-adenosyl-L-methionine hydrolase (adenosine-forming)
MASPRIITLITDFGLSDVYAGVMKGILHARAPDAVVVDLTHEVPPQDVFAAAFALEIAWHHFPAGTVHLVVVDPGVGTDRRRLAIAAGDHYFVGPDNGCLSAALPEEVRGTRPPEGAYDERPVLLRSSLVARAVENFDVLSVTGSSLTFEGRDIFAPAAAFLAGGGRPDALGPLVNDAIAFPAFRAPPTADGIYGRVIAVDRYGNLITDIVASDLPAAPRFEVAGAHLNGISGTYAAASGPSAVVGSSGRVEIAVPGRSAAEILGAGPGDRVRVLP